MGHHIGRIEPYEKYYYIIQEDNNTIVLKGLDNEQRQKVHLLCDKIGLHHKSVKKNNKQRNKHLWIYKPSLWLWEYTEKNPYSKTDEYYIQLEQKKILQQEKHKEKMSRKYCYMCDKNGWDVQLYCSVYIRELYCDNCLETLSDGHGGRLCDHKFEPI